MFINKATDEPAWLVEQDQESDVVYREVPAVGGRPTWSMPAHEFFATHREATAAEVDKHGVKPPPAKPVASRVDKPAAVKAPMQRAAKAEPVARTKTRARSMPKTKPKAAKTTTVAAEPPPAHGESTGQA